MTNTTHICHSPKHCILLLALLGILQTNVLVHLQHLIGGGVYAIEWVDMKDTQSEKEQSEKDGEQEEKDEKQRMELLNARLVNLTILLLHDHPFIEFTTIHHPDIITPPPEEFLVDWHFNLT